MTYLNQAAVEESADISVNEHYYTPPEVDRIWGIWGSYHNIPKAIFYLLKGVYICVRGDT